MPLPSGSCLLLLLLHIMFWWSTHLQYTITGRISGTQAISLIYVALAAGNSDPNIVIIVDVWQMILIRMPGHLYWACICLQKIQGGSIGFVMSAPWYEPLEDSSEDRSAVDRILSFNHRWWVRSSILYDFIIPTPTVPLSVCLKLKNKESLLIM